MSRPKKNQLNSESQIMHPGMIRISHYTERGYNKVCMSIRGDARESTEYSCNKSNKDYKDRDYRQYVGEIDASYDRNSVEITFQEYIPDNFDAREKLKEEGCKKYCEPTWSFSGGRVPKILPMLGKIVDNFGYNSLSPDTIAYNLLKRGWVMVMQERREICLNDGTRHENSMFVRDYISESAVRNRVDAIIAKEEERKRQQDLDSVKYQREWEAKQLLKQDLSPTLSEG